MPNLPTETTENSLKKLTKRTYLGEGYIFEFKNDTTGEYLIEPCSQSEYEAILVSADNNPVKTGWTFIGGAGGTIKVDTMDSILGENDYVEVGNEYIVGRRNRKVAKTDITSDLITGDIYFLANNLVVE